MKVFLVAPYRTDLTPAGQKREDIMPSEALLVLAAVLREAGHEPIMRNYTTTQTDRMDAPREYSLRDSVRIIRENNIKLVGLSFLFGGDFPDALILAEHIKKECPDVKLAIGGIHPTTFPHEILTNIKAVDYVAIGEGETTILELANRIERGDMGDLTELMGFAFRDDDGKVHVRKERALIDYESLPRPAWDLIDFKDYEVDIRNYFNPKGHDLRNIISVFSERGCPFKCTFCDLYMMQGRKVRRRGTTKFIDELEYLANERNQRYFRFQDDNLLVDNKHVIALCEEIVRRGLDIQFDIAGGYVNKYNDAVIDALVAAGMVSTILNIEHGSPYMRDNVIKKPIEHEKIFSVADSLRRYKVNIGTNWIMGFPEETNETLQETYDLITELKPDRANVGTLIPYPGTPIFDQCMKDDLFIEKIDLNTYWRTPFRPHQDGSVIKPYNMSLDELADWRKKFQDIRYRYFGYFHNDFSLPSGYMRDASGSVHRMSA